MIIDLRTRRIRTKMYNIYTYMLKKFIMFRMSSKRNLEILFNIKVIVFYIEFVIDMTVIFVILRYTYKNNKTLNII